MNKPNIFIFFDTLRVDRVFLNYKDENLTPNIKILMKNAIYFKNCIVNSPWTQPSRINMFTGLYSSQYELIKKSCFNVPNIF